MQETKKKKKTGEDPKAKRFLIVLCVLAAIVFTGGGVLFVVSQTGAIKTAGDYATVRLVPGSYSNSAECEGKVEPIRVHDVKTPAKGTVTKVLVKQDDYVRKGTALFEIIDEAGKTHVVEAEIPGTITKADLNYGPQNSHVDEAQIVFQISDMNVLIGSILVPDYLVPYIEKGQLVSITVPESATKERDAWVSSISKERDQEAASEGKVYYTAELMLDDTDGLSVDLPIVASIDIEDYGDVFYVPVSALRAVDKYHYVDIVRANGVIEQHQVELLGTNDAGEAIIKGPALANGTLICADISE